MNNQKAFMARVGFRPLPRTHAPQGLAPPGLLDARQLHERRAAQPHGLQHDLRTPVRQHRLRLPRHEGQGVGGAHQRRGPLPTLDGKGWSFWATPKKPFPNGSSIEALIRYDHMKPGGTASATAITLARRPERADDRRRAPTGSPSRAACRPRSCSTSEHVKFSNWTPAKPTTAEIFVHSLICF